MSTEIDSQTALKLHTFLSGLNKLTMESNVEIDSAGMLNLKRMDGGNELLGTLSHDKHGAYFLRASE